MDFSIDFSRICCIGVYNSYELIQSGNSYESIQSGNWIDWSMDFHDSIAYFVLRSEVTKRVIMRFVACFADPCSNIKYLTRWSDVMAWYRHRHIRDWSWS